MINLSIMITKTAPHRSFLPPSLASVLQALILALGLTLGASAPSLAGDFLSGTEDVPLMPGLRESPGTVLFDTPQGRIVEAFAQGDVNGEQLQAFYQSTLPQLGWSPSGDGYRRDHEILKIEIQARPAESKVKGLTVRFAIAPE